MAKDKKKINIGAILRGGGNIALRTAKFFKNLPYNTGVLFRRTKFAVLGIKNSEKRTMRGRLLWERLKNPKTYIPAVKPAVFFAASAVYVIAAVGIAARCNTVGTASAAGNEYLPMTFSAEKSAVGIELNWDDGVVELEDGKAYATLSAQIIPKYFEKLGIEWTSSNDKIAVVSQNGDVTAIAPGEAEITARIKKIPDSYASAHLRVLQPITGIFMTTSDVTLYMGGSGKYLKAKIFPENATESKLKWTSKNPEVATVDSSGYVKAAGLGMTEIVAETTDGKFSCKSFVTVVNESVNVRTVNIENGDSELAEGETLNLVASVLPYNARNKTLTWSSGDESILKVNQTGRIKGIKAGKTTVTAKSVNGIESKITVTVVASDKKDGFDLTDESATVVSGEGAVTYESYSQTLPAAAEIQMGLSTAPKIWRGGTHVNATLSEVAEYMNPANYCDDTYKYQFLDLSSSNGVSVDALNQYLADKGILSGHGDAFKRAAETYNVSEVYLVAHACLESGNGTSQLSTGVEVNGTIVYNMFGIGAYDSSALYSGSQKAYKEGWTSVDAAIMGGAEWISKYYINAEGARQNTLYKMLWNPDSPGEHQYATDVAWAVKQAQSIAGIFESFPDAVLSYSVPVYSGQTAPAITAD